MSYKLFLILSFLTINNLFASPGMIVFPLGEKHVKDYLQVVSKISPKTLGFDPKKCKVSKNNTEGSARFYQGGSSEFMLYYIDINNDGVEEYLTIFINGGSLATSGINNVLSSKTLQPIDFSKIVSKNLFNDSSGDLSKFHLWLAAPAIVKRNEKYILRYYDQKPKPLFIEYLWEKSSFKKLKSNQDNTY